MAELLRRIRNFLAEQWWRFLIGISFLTLINFILLVLTASDKLKALTGVRFTAEVVLLLVPLAIIAVWLWGLILEKYIKFPQQQEREAWKRSPIWQETHRKLDEILARLARLERKR
ncbi:MAG: hypothetical protein QXG98_01410 [Candidatus Micrarchaeia archaeon]